MANARFPRRARLTTKAEFRRVFAQPTRSADRYFTVLFRSNELDHARLGLAVSRKCARFAVARNRIKRMVRESFRQRQQTLTGLDIVVIGRPQLTQYDNRVFAVSLQQHWQRLAELNNA